MVLWCFGGEAEGSPVSRTHCSVSFPTPAVCPSWSLTVKDFVPFSCHPQVFAFLGCFFFFFIFIYLFILAALGLHCCAQAFSSCSEQGFFFVVVASLIAEHGL